MCVLVYLHCTTSSNVMSTVEVMPKRVKRGGKPGRLGSTSFNGALVRGMKIMKANELRKLTENVCVCLTLIFHVFAGMFLKVDD